MSSKKYYWLKLKNDFFKRHDIRIVESMPNGKDYVLFYLKLLVESVGHNGELRFSDTIPYNEDMLATITNTNIDVVRSALKVFTELNLMETLDDQTIYMAEIEKMTGSETAWAEKKRKQKLLPKLHNCKRLNGEMIRLPDGQTKYVDEKRYGGNGMLAYDLALGKCERCGSNDNLMIHHNNGYSNNIEDLFILCSKCHEIVEGGKCPPLVHSPSRLVPPGVRQEKEKEKEKEKDKELEQKKDLIHFWRDQCIHPVNSVTVESIVHWYNDIGYDLVKEAMTLAAKKGVTNFRYVEGIMKRFDESGIKNLEDLEIAKKNYEAKKQSEPVVKKNSFHNHQQHDYDFDALERQMDELLDERLSDM